jgi:hypothetical protein
MTFKGAAMPERYGGGLSSESERERIRKFAGKILEQGLLACGAERNSAAETVDTPAEVQRLAGECCRHV